MGSCFQGIQDTGEDVAAASSFTTGWVCKWRTRIGDGLKTSRSATPRDLHLLARPTSISRGSTASQDSATCWGTSVPTREPLGTFHMQDTAASVDTDNNDAIILIISVIIIMIMVLYSFHQKRGNLIFLPRLWYPLMTLLSCLENGDL